MPFVFGGCFDLAYDLGNSESFYMDLYYPGIDLHSFVPCNLCQSTFWQHFYFRQGWDQRQIWKTLSEYFFEKSLEGPTNTPVSTYFHSAKIPVHHDSHACKRFCYIDSAAPVLQFAIHNLLRQALASWSTISQLAWSLQRVHDDDPVLPYDDILQLQYIPRKQVCYGV